MTNSLIVSDLKISTGGCHCAAYIGASLHPEINIISKLGLADAVLSANNSKDGHFYLVSGRVFHVKALSQQDLSSCIRNRKLISL